MRIKNIKGSDKSLFSHLLFEKNILGVFMTATERFILEVKTIVSMDDIDIYGDVFSKMTFKWEKVLNDYKIIMNQKYQILKIWLS